MCFSFNISLCFVYTLSTAKMMLILSTTHWIIQCRKNIFKVYHNMIYVYTAPVTEQTKKKIWHWPLLAKHWLKAHSKGELYVLLCSLALVGNLGCLTWQRHCNHKSSTTHSYLCVQIIYATAHGGFMDTIRKSAQKDDSGKKSCHTRD